MGQVRVRTGNAARNGILTPLAATYVDVKASFLGVGAKLLEIKANLLEDFFRPQRIAGGNGGVDKGGG